MMTVAYFCKATEIRFLTDKNNNNINNQKPNKANSSSNSTNEDSEIESNLKFNQGEHWHCMALKISCEFLPSTSPIVRHYISSYSKHFSNNMQEIVNQSFIYYKIFSLKTKKFTALLNS